MHIKSYLRSNLIKFSEHCVIFFKIEVENLLFLTSVL